MKGYVWTKILQGYCIFVIAVLALKVHQKPFAYGIAEAPLYNEQCKSFENEKDQTQQEIFGMKNCTSLNVKGYIKN
jgi:hypothetical protein